MSNTNNAHLLGRMEITCGRLAQQFSDIARVLLGLGRNQSMTP